MPASNSKCKKVLSSDKCNHDQRPDDPHPSCEGCRKLRHGVDSLCTLDNRCSFCAHLSKEQFEVLLKRREQNKHKNDLRQKRKTMSRSASLPASPLARHTSVPKTTPLDLSGSVVKDKPAPTASTAKGEDSASFLSSLHAQAAAALELDFEKATYNQLFYVGINAVEYCKERQFHSSTIRITTANPQYMDMPLREVSRFCFASDDAADYKVTSALVPTATATQSVASSSVTTVPETPVKSPTTRSKTSLSLPKNRISPKSAKKSTKPVVITKPKWFSTETKFIPREGSDKKPVLLDDDDDVTVSAITSPPSSARSSPEEPLSRRDVTSQSLRELRAMTPMCVDRSFDDDPTADGSSAPTLDLKKLYEIIAESVPEVQAAPVQPYHTSTSIRSALQGESTVQPRVGLTTQPTLKNCVVSRQLELKHAQNNNKAKELTRQTNSEILRVKSHMYEPGDATWSIKAPPCNEGFQPWLPLLDRNHAVPLSYNDAINVETIARVLQKNGALIESTLMALAPFLDQHKNDPVCGQLTSYSVL